MKNSTKYPLYCIIARVLLNRMRKIKYVFHRAIVRVFQNPIARWSHILYYEMPHAWRKNTFLGLPVLQNPSDMHLYQEKIFELGGCSVLQTGVENGGSILYFAFLLDIMNAPKEYKVVGIDIILTPKAKSITHPRVILIEGDSSNPKVAEKARSHLSGKILVSLDSAHSTAHVLKELDLYAPLADYLIVEDTNIAGHPVRSTWVDGPKEAVDLFPWTDFVEEKMTGRVLFSFHTWLKRI